MISTNDESLLGTLVDLTLEASLDGNLTETFTLSIEFEEKEEVAAEQELEEATVEDIEEEVFAGVEITGITVSPDLSATRNVYYNTTTSLEYAFSIPVEIFVEDVILT